MVSQPDPHRQQTLALRGPSSVVSARTSSRPHVSSRSKRYNRSHAGGTSYLPQNEFPVFSHSGDVEIFISAGGRENRYLLHRHTLTRCSGFFEASTSQEWSKASVVPPPMAVELPARELTRIGEGGNGNTFVGGGGDVARTDASSPVPRRRWRYELDQGTGIDDIPMLIQKEANTANSSSNNATTTNGTSASIFGGGTRTTTSANSHALRSSSSNAKSHAHTHSTNSFFRSVANLSLAPAKTADTATEMHPLTQADEDLLRDYDNLFRIFYNYPPVLDGISIADAYVQSKSLLTLADQYDALAVVGPRVDHHLLQFQSRLWKQIAKYPISYLRLGYLARSKVIFQEALIHVVGQWPAGERSIRQNFPDAVLDIIEDKVDELEETVARVEGRLFRLALTNARGERVSPASGYLDWLAMSLFRQWLADNTAPAPVVVGSHHHHHHPPLSSSSSSSSAARGHGHGHGHHHNHHHHHHHSSSSSSSHRGPATNTNTAIAATPATASPSLASVGRTYRTLGGSSSSSSSSAASYLTHDECKRFLKLSPDLYSRDNLRRFEKRIDELKGAAREVVRPLMGSGLELELERSAGSGGGGGGGGGGGMMMSYLTCVSVMERDLPWDVED
ncbi:hypothetical protein F4778DRAFT_794783 [Xylariomycetidae sp. FL2044]|nr:hypothetical protein F4778DRAFT_794783 [Xylariomycetidae sp. FL2044]